MSRLTKLSYLEQNMLIDWFAYFMGPEQRERLMSELPVIYNKLFEAEIVQVVRVSDGSKVGD